MLNSYFNSFICPYNRISKLCKRSVFISLMLNFFVVVLMISVFLFYFTEFKHISTTVRAIFRRIFSFICLSTSCISSLFYFVEYIHSFIIVVNSSFPFSISCKLLNVMMALSFSFQTNILLLFAINLSLGCSCFFAPL